VYFTGCWQKEKRNFVDAGNKKAEGRNLALKTMPMHV
jgi:hypothetical protein